MRGEEFLAAFLCPHVLISKTLTLLSGWLWGSGKHGAEYKAQREIRLSVNSDWAPWPAAQALLLSWLWWDPWNRLAVSSADVMPTGGTSQPELLLGLQSRLPQACSVPDLEPWTWESTGLGPWPRLCSLAMWPPFSGPQGLHL